MSVIWWGLIGLGVVLGSAPMTGGGRQVSSQRLDGFARRQRLPLPDHLSGAVARRLMARERSAVRWGVVGLVAGVLLALGIDLAAGIDLGPLALLGGTLGASIGGYVGIASSIPDLDPSTPRVARARSTAVDDYVTGLEVWAGRLVPVVVAAAAAVAVLVWALSPLRPDGGAIVPVVVVLAAAAVIGAWALLRRAGEHVLDQPQRARDDLGLAWDDVLRTTALREVQDTKVGIGLAATLGLLAIAGTWVVDPAVRAEGMDRTLVLGMTLGVTGMVCWALLLVPWGVGRLRRSPSRGLWQDTARTGA